MEHGPPRGARRHPRHAAGGRRVRRPGPDRRGVPARRAAGRVPGPRPRRRVPAGLRLRAAPVTLELPPLRDGDRAGRGAAPAGDVADPGAQQPRPGPPRHPVRARAGASGRAHPAQPARRAGPVRRRGDRHGRRRSLAAARAVVRPGRARCAAHADAVGRLTAGRLHHRPTVAAAGRSGRGERGRPASRSRLAAPPLPAPDRGAGGLPRPAGRAAPDAVGGGAGRDGLAARDAG